MSALVATFAALALASAVPPEAVPDVRWIQGPASVELAEGRVRCALPGGVALAAGPEARAILAVVAGETDGREVAVVAPVEPEHRWYVVVGWEPGNGAARRRWSVRGAGRGDEAIVNEHVLVPREGGAIRLTLVTTAAELAEAREHLERIVEGFARPEPPKRARR
jgi:hypothetical protein